MKRKFHRIGILLATSALLLGLLAACGNKPSGDNVPPSGNTVPPAEEQGAGEGQAMSWNAAPEMALVDGHTYEAIVTTNAGSFELELYADKAPITVNNFVFLAREGFYEGIKFHRIIETFMIQGGDPTGTGMGGPGYTITDEWDTGYPFEKGTISMAKTNLPDSAGSQFFICTGDECNWMTTDKKYKFTNFGKIKSGMDTIEKIAKTPVGYSESERANTRPLEDVIIEKIEIVEHS